MWQILETKARFINQVMSGESTARTMDDVDDGTLSYATAKALASGNPLIKESIELEIDITRLQTLKAQYKSQLYAMQDAVRNDIPKSIARLEQRIEGIAQDIELFNQNDNKDFSMTILNKVYDNKEEAGKRKCKTCGYITLDSMEKMTLVCSNCGAKL